MSVKINERLGENKQKEHNSEGGESSPPRKKTFPKTIVLFPVSFVYISVTKR